MLSATVSMVRLQAISHTAVCLDVIYILLPIYNGTYLAGVHIKQGSRSGALQ